MDSVKKHRISKNVAAMLTVTAVMLVINGVSWLSRGAADFNADVIFPAISAKISLLTGLLPFSLGEVMICTGIVLVLAAPFVFIYGALKNKKLLRTGGTVYGWVLVFLFSVLTINYFALYHTTELSDKYHGGAAGNGFTTEQLIQVCEECIISANELADIVERGENGEPIIPENMDELAENALNNISDKYPTLAGKSPVPKKIFFSGIMTQLDLQGIYFPYSMEANYNRMLAPARTPCTIVHELVHLKGFIREDEAGFLAYRACLTSESPEVRYSGYLSAINYLMSAVYNNVSADEYFRLVDMMDQRLLDDDYFVSEEYLIQIEETSVIPSETASAVSASAMDAALKINGVSDGKKSYGRMVDLILEYRFYIQKS